MTWILRLIAGILLIPPATPIGLLLWYWAHRIDKKNKRAERQAQALEQLADDNK